MKRREFLKAFCALVAAPVLFFKTAQAEKRVSCVYCGKTFVASQFVLDHVPPEIVDSALWSCGCRPIDLPGKIQKYNEEEIERQMFEDIQQYTDFFKHQKDILADCKNISFLPSRLMYRG